MALKIAPRVKQTSTTPGQGTIELSGTPDGFQTFVLGIGVDNECPYYITDGTDWEEGIGTVTATPGLVRDTIIGSSNGGAAVNWPAGTRDVRCGHPTSNDQIHEVFGHMGGQLLTKTAAYTVTVDDRGALIDCDTSSAAFTITLPAAMTVKKNFIVGFRKTTNDINYLTIDGNGSETIDGDDDIKIQLSNVPVWLVCDGANWKVLIIGGEDRPRSNRNAVRNGAMNIDQRDTDTSAVTMNSATAIYALDGWFGIADGNGEFTIERDAEAAASAAPGFEYCLLATVTTAEGSPIGTTEVHTIRQRIEGYRIQEFQFGTADARDVAISFWLKTSVAGSYGVAIKSIAQNRSVVTVVVATADTWEYHTIWLPGDIVTNTWESDDGIGFELAFCVGAGANFQTTAKTWVGDNKLTTSAQVQWIETNAATFRLSGVQLEAGRKSTPFEYKQPAIDLLENQRYLWVNSMDANGIVVNLQCLSTSQAQGPIRMPTEMRAVPTLSVSSGGHFDLFTSTGGAATVSAITSDSRVEEHVANLVVNTTGTLLAAGDSSILAANNASAKLTFDAEL